MTIVNIPADKPCQPFGERTEPTERTEQESVKSKTRRCGIDQLDVILSKIEPIDWERHDTNEKTYILRSIEQTIDAADKAGRPIINHNEIIYRYTGTHYKPIAKRESEHFLIEAARQYFVISTAKGSISTPKMLSVRIFCLCANVNSPKCFSCQSSKN